MITLDVLQHMPKCLRQTFDIHTPFFIRFAGSIVTTVTIIFGIEDQIK